MPDFEFRRTTEQHTAAMRLTRPKAQIGAAMAEAFPKIYHAVVTAGVEPAGMPLARYFAFDEAATTFECAIPVLKPFTAAGEVQPSTVGGGEAAFTVHVGPYDAIGQTWEALIAWVTAQGRTPAGPHWEIYLDDPQETAETELKTELYVPVT